MHAWSFDRVAVCADALVRRDTQTDTHWQTLSLYTSLVGK